MPKNNLANCFNPFSGYGFLMRSLSESFETLFPTRAVEVAIIDGPADPQSCAPTFDPHSRSAPSASNASLKTGDVMQAGRNTGWIYCDTPTCAPFLVAPRDSGVMTWREARELAKLDGSQLPSRKQLQAMYDIRNAASLASTFTLAVLSPAAWYWSAAGGSDFAWCLKFFDGLQNDTRTSLPASVRFVRTLTF